MPRLDPEIRVSLNAYLRTHYVEHCRHWFDEIEPLDIAGGVLRLLVREPVQLRYLQRVCTPFFTEAAQAVTGRLLAVRFVGTEEISGSQHDDELMLAARGESKGDRRTMRSNASTSADGGSRRHSPQDVAYHREDSAAPGVAEVESAQSPRHPDGGSIGGVGGGGSGGDATREGTRGAPLGTSQRGPVGVGTTHQRDYFAGASVGGAHAGSDGHFDGALPSLDDQTLLSPDYSFDNFVVGPGNRLAHAAAMAVADRPGRAYNPYFIHGGVGLGKTHLLQAICQTILRRSARARICYISCDTFMDLFHEAVRAGRMLDFRSRFRSADVLVIDDIHFLSKHEQTQEEFFHTFNALYQTGKQIVLSSDAAPSEIPDLEERLTSRFSCGLVARIERPDYESRVAIVKAKARMHDLEIPDDVPAYIAAKFDSNIRELEGALTKIRGLAMALKHPINLDLAKQALADITSSSTSGQPSIQLIIDEVSRFFDVKLTDLLSKRRHKSIALPRQVCMWLARKHTRYSLEEIGGYFGGRDHTTVMHAIRTINSKTGGDAKLSADVSRLEQQLLQRIQ